MKTKKFPYSIRQKMFFIYGGLLLATCMTLVISCVVRFGKVYKRQADSHMADITSMSAENIANVEEQINQLSVSVLIDQTVQNNLKIINERSEFYNENTGEGSVSSYELIISQQVRRKVFDMEGVVSLRIYPEKGKEIFVGTVNPEYMEYSMTKEEIYEANGAPLWRETGKEHCICLGRAILDINDMQPLGYMIIVCRNDYFGRQLSTVSDAYSGTVYLTDEENHIMTSSVLSASGKIFPYNLQELSEKKPLVITDPVSKEKSYYYMTTVNENNWTIITTVSTRQFRRNVLMIFFQLLIFVAFILTVSLFVTRKTLETLLAPGSRLLESMSEFGKGKFDSRAEIRTRDEIGLMGETYNQMADNIQNLMEQVYALKIANKEAEIGFLKMQINPHFLYNSLDTISWLGIAAGEEKISGISIALARMLRMSIKRADIITVKEEMEIVESYLFIQECRFEDKIKTEYQVDEGIYECYMPGFLLQPLVENSIVHGLEQRIERGHLNICISRKEEWLYFSVSDDGQGIEREKLERLKQQCQEDNVMEESKGIGLKNVYRRLRLLYGDSSKFQIFSEEGKGTKVSFRIPVITQMQ